MNTVCFWTNFFQGEIEEQVPKCLEYINLNVNKSKTENSTYEDQAMMIGENVNILVVFLAQKKI